MKQLKFYIIFILSGLFLYLPLHAQMQTEQEALQQVSHLRSEQKWEDAIEIIKPIYERSPFDQNLYGLLFELYIDAKAWSDAHALNNRMLTIKRNDPLIILDKVIILRKEGQPKEARVLFDSLLQDLPMQKIRIDQFAQKLEQSDWYDDAAKVYLKGRELLNNEWLYASELVHVHLQLGKIKEAAGFVLDMIYVPRNTMDDVQEAMMRIIDADDKGGNILKRQIQSRIKSNPNDYNWNELWNWYLLTQGDGEQAVKEMIALDKALEEKGKRVVPLARYFTNSNEFQLSVQLWDYVISQGEKAPYYEVSRIGKVRTYLSEYELHFPNTRIHADEIIKVFNDLLIDFPEQKISDLYRKYISFQVNYLENVAWGIKEIKELVDQLKLTSSKDLYLQSKLDYADYLVFNKEIWESAIVLAQIEKEDPQGTFGEWSKFKSAELAFFRGDFTWAKQVLDILKAATTDYIANDALALSVLISENSADAQAEEALKDLSKVKLLVKQFRYDAAIILIDSLLGNNAHKDLEPYYYWEAFTVYSKQGQLDPAEKALKNLLEDYEEHVLADDATYQLAVLYHHKKKEPSLALEYYESLILNYPASTFVISSRKALEEIKAKHKNL